MSVKIYVPRPYGNSCLPSSFPASHKGNVPKCPRMSVKMHDPPPLSQQRKSSPTQYFLLPTFYASRLAASPDLTVECAPTNVTLLVKFLAFHLA